MQCQMLKIASQMLHCLDYKAAFPLSTQIATPSWLPTARCSFLLRDKGFLHGAAEALGILPWIHHRDGFAVYHCALHGMLHPFPEVILLQAETLSLMLRIHNYQASGSDLCRLQTVSALQSTSNAMLPDKCILQVHFHEAVALVCCHADWQ